MKKLNEYEVEVLKERGIYDIDVLDQGKQLIGLTVDTNRGQYYIIKPEDEIVSKEVINAYSLIKNEIIDKIARKKFNGTLVGETKSYTEEVLNGLFNSLGVYPISEEENKKNTELMENYVLYSNGSINEQDFNGYLYK